MKVFFACKSVMHNGQQYNKLNVQAFYGLPNLYNGVLDTIHTEL